MKSKFDNIIMTIIMFFITGVLVIFGILFLKEVTNQNENNDVEEFQTVLGEEETTKTTEENIETPKIIENPLNDIQENNNNTNKVDYSNVNLDNYFYNQLDEYSKIIYKAFESNKENMKTGTYKIELGDNFSSILKQEDGQDKLGKYYQSAIEAYTYDNPEIFYLSPNKMYLNIETSTYKSDITYNVYINSGKQSNYLVDEFSSKEQIDQAIFKIEQIKNEVLQNRTENTYNNIKMVHDYIVDNTEYDQEISKANIYNIYGCLVNKVAVCEGYARTFKYLMDELNIPCVLVIGKGTNSEGKTENHAWNYIKLDNGTWYAVDSTWDDPVIQGGGTASKNSKYRYFLKGESTFLKDHTVNGQFTEGGKVFEYPKLAKEDIN